MNVRELAADTRDPIGTIAFGVLGLLGSLGLIPESVSANDLAELVGWIMGILAGAFALFHHKDLKLAIKAGRKAREDVSATPQHVGNDRETPLDASRDADG